MAIIQDPGVIDAWLQQGVTVASIMHRSSWGRSQVKARAMRMRLLIDPATDKAYSLNDSPEVDVDEAEDHIHQQVATVREAAAPSTLKGAPPIQPGRIDSLLAAAEASGVQRIAARADTIRQRIEELAEALRGEQERIKARKEIETLERRLAELRSRARGMKSSVHQELTPDQIEVRRANGRRSYEKLNAVCQRFNVTPADVRTWCRDNGLDVPVTGPIKMIHCDAYEQAHSTEDVA